MTNGTSAATEERDVFISYVHADRAAVAKPIAEALIGLGWAVWFDEFELRVGDSLVESLNRGIASSSAGVVILSPAYLAREYGWARRELAALLAQQIRTRKPVLPVWHDVSADEVSAVLPILGDLIAATGDGPQAVAAAISAALGALKRGDTSAQAVEQARQMRARNLIEIVDDELRRPTLRRRAARELGEFADAASSHVLITRVRSDPDERVREACASALGRLREPRARPCLLEALTDTGAHVRLAAAGALQRLGDPTGLPVLHLLLKHRNAGLRARAVTTLRDLEEPESLQALVKALTTDEHGPVRHRAAEALAAINDPRAIDPLLARLEIEDDDYWGALAWAVAQLRDSRCLAVFVPLLSDLSTPAERRRTAAYGLGLLGGPVATASLVAAVRQDPDVDVRKEAIWALIEGMAEDAIPSLREAAERGDESERHLALWAVDCLSRDSLEDGGVQIRRMW